MINKEDVYKEINEFIPFFIIRVTEWGEIVEIYQDEKLPIHFRDGSSFLDYLHKTRREELVKDISKLHKDPTKITKYLRLNDSDNRSWFECELAIDKVDDNNLIRITGVNIDSLMKRVDRYRTKISSLKNLAYRDPLTSSYNRRGFWHRLREMRKTLGERELAIVYVDIDNLKKANDKLGHDYGDEQIKGVCDVLNSCVRNSDIVSRFGGDEFVILLRARKGEILDYMKVTQRIIERVSKDKSLTVTVSMGVQIFELADLECNSFTECKKAIQKIIQKADHKVVAGKRKKKNEIYD